MAESTTPRYYRVCTTARRLITVEPVLLLFTLANTLRSAVVKTMLYDRVCATNFNITVCASLHNETYKTFETFVQENTSRWEFYESLTYSVPSAITSLLYASWLDNYSRKFPMLFSPIGTMIAALIYIVIALESQAGPGYMLLGGLALGLAGGTIFNVTSCISYLAVINPRETRTIRISIAESMVLVAGSLSFVSSGPLIKQIGYVAIFIIVVSLGLVTMVFIIFWIEDIRPQKLSDGVDPNETKCLTLTKGLLSFHYYRESVMVAFRVREGQKRHRIIALLSIVVLYFFSYNSMTTLAYLFVRHTPLSWSPSLYGYYSAVNYVSQGLGLLVVLPILKLVFKVTDTLVIPMAICSEAGGLILFAFSKETWMVFLVPVLTILSMTNIICIRSLLSTLVRKDELGKIYAGVSTTETLTYLLAAAMYNMVLYPASLSFFPGFSFVLAACLLTAPFSIAIWLHSSYKKDMEYGTLSEHDKHISGL